MKIVKLNDGVGIGNGECDWSFNDDETDTYDTGCNDIFTVSEFSVSELGIAFCPICGRRVNVILGRDGEIDQLEMWETIVLRASELMEGKYEPPRKTN